MKVICITNHELLPDGRLGEMSYRSWKKAYVEEIKRIDCCGPAAVIVREKLLSGIEYTDLYQAISKDSITEQTELIWHDHYEALRLFMRFHRRSEWPASVFFSGREAGAIPDADLRELKRDGIRFGLPCHSMIELKDALCAGADFITASHIFNTACKIGKRPKGLDFLREVSSAVTIPVIALGGIDVSNAASCIEAGAAGVAVMSLAMREDKAALRDLIALE